MKRPSVCLDILLVLVLVAMGSGCAEDEVEPEAEETSTPVQVSDDGKQVETQAGIQPGTGVADVRFGMTVQEMKETLGEPDIDATGISYVYADRGIEVVFRDGLVHSIYCVDHIDNAPEVKTCTYRTPEGIGVGSTESEILSAYGQPFKRTQDALMYKEQGLRFELDNAQVQKVIVLQPW